MNTRDKNPRDKRIARWANDVKWYYHYKEVLKNLGFTWWLRKERFMLHFAGVETIKEDGELMISAEQIQDYFISLYKPKWLHHKK